MSTTTLGGFYTVPQFPGVAVYVAGPVMHEVEPEPVLLCEEDPAEHDHEDLCYAYDDEWEEVPSETEVWVVMVGDDRKHAVDRDDLTPLGEGGFCYGCGQVDCGH